MKSAKNNISSLARIRKSPRHLLGAVIVLAIAVGGAIWLTKTFAASQYVAIQATSGSLTCPATVASNPSASNGQYVNFGNPTSCSTGGGGGGTGGGGGGGGSTGSMNPPSGYTSNQRILDDQFSGTSLNSGTWNTFYGPGVPWQDNGSLPSPYSGGNQPGSNDLAIYSPSQLSVNNGLTITAQRYSGTYSYLGYQWISGTITSKNPLPSSGWYVQVKAQMPDTSQGMWPAIWALPGSSSQEIDGYEGGWPGSNPNQQGHSDTFAAGGQIQQVWSTPGGANVSTGYHVYGFQFTPGSGMSFYFDGAKVYGSSSNLSQQAYYLLIQLQVAADSTAGWHTVTNSGTPASSMKVAEVQVYN